VTTPSASKAAPTDKKIGEGRSIDGLITLFFQKCR
jgi:hypothetical protein